jgi:Ser/Thr protein kinase RdoA (MazF antagonist)
MTKRDIKSAIPQEVLSSYAELSDIEVIEPISMGLINKTYVARSLHNKVIIQEVSPIFDVTINFDNEAVSRHLEHRGLVVPRLYRTVKDELFVSYNGRVFRALRFIEGENTHTIKSLVMAESCGRLLGRFHAAGLDFDYEYQSKRRHGGDYHFHRDNLIGALKEHRDHPYYRQVSPLAEEMLLNMAQHMAGFTTTPRNVHGDPKASNILFQGDVALCLVDFDTLGKTGWSLEVADALRSWCNPRQEDVLDGHVDLAIAEKALVGYGSIMRGIFTEKEAHEVIIHSHAITLCLSMRYLADVLNERYFMHDSSRFSRSAEHNWLRAQSMYNLYIDFLSKKRQLAAIVHDFLF